MYRLPSSKIERSTCISFRNIFPFKTLLALIVLFSYGIKGLLNCQTRTLRKLYRLPYSYNVDWHSSCLAPFLGEEGVCDSPESPPAEISLDLDDCIFRSNVPAHLPFLDLLLTFRRSSRWWIDHVTYLMVTHPHTICYNPKDVN
jgi:hypothetical protein